MRHRVAAVAQIPENGGIAVDVGERRIAIFRSRGRLFALDETCPHRGGPLHEGSIENDVIFCPWHQWQFDLVTGASPLNPLSRVRVYPVVAEGADVFVEID